MKNTIIAL